MILEKTQIIVRNSATFDSAALSGSTGGLLPATADMVTVVLHPRRRVDVVSVVIVTIRSVVYDGAMDIK